ncbi:hypothetical protein Y1Q_0010904 [Alligator mississippiensis]|uniref:Uncharacterized protein n=1 Tax=Alligator mississippiensis TaxID=8496 RepID=A0A151M791_ALLMI|nr:hypothetical protein Y1Q_0010904 [Alligator mississippiensis]
MSDLEWVALPPFTPGVHNSRDDKAQRPSGEPPRGQTSVVLRSASHLHQGKVGIHGTRGLLEFAQPEMMAQGTGGSDSGPSWCRPASHGDGAVACPPARGILLGDGGARGIAGPQES